MQHLKNKHEPFTIIPAEPAVYKKGGSQHKQAEDLSFKDHSEYVSIPRKWIYYILVAFCIAKLALGAALFLYADYKIEQKLKQVTNTPK